MKILVTKDDIVKLKKIVDYHNLMKDLSAEIRTLKGKGNFSEASIMIVRK